MSRGFSILEVLIALTILSLTIIAVTLLTLGMPGMLANARMHANGTLQAEYGFSREVAQLAQAFSPYATTSRTNEDLFTTDVTKEIIGDGSANRITSTSRWYTEWGEQRTSTITGIITDYVNAKNYVCSTFSIVTNKSPHLEEVASVLPPLSTLTASRTHLVATASSTLGNNDPSLFIFKIQRNDSALTLWGSVDVATTSRTGYSTATLSRDTLYAFSAHASCTGECVRLEIFSLTESLLQKKASIPIPRVRSSIYQDGRLYVGLYISTTFPEFIIFDVSEPHTPKRIGSSEIGASVTDIRIQGTTAFVATADSSTPGNKALLAFNIDTPAEDLQPYMRSRQPGAGISQELFVSGDVLYLGRSSPLNSKELYAFSTNDIQTPLVARDTDSSIAGLVTQGLYLYVLTRSVIERIPLESLENTHDSIPLPEGFSGVALACGGKRIYVAANTPSRGYLLTLSGI